MVVISLSIRRVEDIKKDIDMVKVIMDEIKGVIKLFIEYCY